MLRRLAIGLVLVLVLATPAAGQDPYDEKEDVDARLAEARAQLAEIESRESALTAEIGAVSGEILALEREVGDVSSRLAALEHDLALHRRAGGVLAGEGGLDRRVRLDRVRTRGIETAFSIAEVGIETLSLEGSIAYAQARILRNENHPDYVGNWWPRVPDWRGNLQAAWRPSPSWLASLGYRYSGKTFGRLENDDFNGDTYGGISRVNAWEGRVAYTTTNGAEIAVGIDNITNDRAYQSHPYPSRTAFAEVRWALGGGR